MMDDMKNLVKYVLLTEQRNFFEWVEESGADYDGELDTGDHAYALAVRIARRAYPELLS